MSDFDDSPRRRRSMRARDRDPEYTQESSYMQRGPGRQSTDLVYRGRDDSIEDIPRDWPPQAESRRSKYRDDYSSRRSRSTGRRDDDDDYYSDGGAGYGRSRRDKRDRRYHDDGYQSDDPEPRHDRRKSKVEEMLDGLGLGGAVAAITGSRSRSRSRGARSRRGSPDSDRSMRTRGEGGRKKWHQAATAALVTGAVEAWRSRNEPGGLTGAKGKRIATAALAAAGIDSMIDKNPDEKRKRHIAESVIGGLVTNRLANGPRDRSASRGRSVSRDDSQEGERPRSTSRFSLRSLSRGRFGRSPSRDGDESQSRRGSGIKGLMALGGIAAASKALASRALISRALSKSRERERERARERSQSRGRDRSQSRSSSEDSFVPTRRQRYARDSSATADGYNDNRVARTRGRGDEGGGERKRDNSSSSLTTATADLENQRKRTRGPPSAYPPTVYSDANPYAAAIPPPPIGSPPQSKY